MESTFFNGVLNLLIFLATLINYFKSLNQCSLNVSESKSCMTNIILRSKWIKNNKLVSKRSIVFILAKFNFVTIQIEQIRFKNHSIEMKKSAEISAETLFHICIEPFQVSRNHKDQTKATYSSEIRYAQGSVIEYFFYNHYNRPKIFTLFN